MKGNLNKICLAVVSTIVPVSCNFLNVENVGKSDIESFFSEVPALEAANYGVYHTAYGVFDSYLFTYAEVVADELVLNTESGADWVPYQDFTNKSSDETGALGMVWKNAYNVINNINEMLYYGPGLRKTFPTQAATVDNVLAQAYFMRALMHLQLCLCYGQNYTFTDNAGHMGVPVVDHILSLTEKIARNPVYDVYSSIVSDLNTALDLFPAGADYSSAYFANPLAAKALLARVYLYSGNWAQAESYASQVMAARQLTPRDGYRNLFCTRTPANDESIFRFNGFQLGKSSYKMYYYAEPKARPSERVKALLADDADIRKGMLKYDDEYSDVVMKYTCTDVVSSEEDRYYNPVVLRVSEMYLIHAEACCERGGSGLDDAAKDLKALQARARGIKPEDVVLTWSTKDNLLKLIEEERIRELCFEGHRLWDLTRRHKELVRTDDNTSIVRKITYPDYRFVMPIPAVELEANSNMVNNPNYD